MTALLFISAQERLEDSGTLQYPSITFCPKYIWQVTSPGISHTCCSRRTRAANEPSVKFSQSRAFSWLKASTSAFTKKKIIASDGCTAIIKPDGQL